MKIIILQTDSHARNGCRTALEGMGLQENVDYSLRGWASGLVDCWTPNDRQLFITGTVHGNEEVAEQIVRDARRINTELVCMSFSVCELNGPFDHNIVKEYGQTEKNLQVAVRGFLDGTINRAG
jgi:hypothetical protein